MHGAGRCVMERLVEPGAGAAPTALDTKVRGHRRELVVWRSTETACRKSGGMQMCSIHSPPHVVRVRSRQQLERP